MKFNVVTVCFVQALLLHCVSASADSMDKPVGLEDLLNIEVTGPSRFAQPIGNTPAVVTVIDSRDIWQYGVRNIAEAIRFAPSAYISEDRGYSYLGMRGFSRAGDYNSRVQFLVDGIALNDPIYDQAMIGDEAPVDVAWLKRVEFSQGPSAAPNGGNAMFGLINASLKNGSDIGGKSVSLKAGTRGDRSINVLAGDSVGNEIDWMFGFVHASNDGETLKFPEFAAPGNPAGQVRGLDGSHLDKLIGKITVGNWRASLIYADRRKDIPTAYYGTVFDAPGTWTNDESLHFSLSHLASLNRDWQQTVSLHYGRYAYVGQYRYGYGLNRDTANATWWDGSYKLLYSGRDAHTLTVGVDARFGVHSRQQNYDIDPVLSYLNDRRREKHLGVYVVDQWELHKSLLLNWGLRSDYFSGDKYVSSPRAALIYRPLPATSLKLLYGVGFRPANTYERFYDDGGATQKSNPGLLDEKLTSYEIALEHLLSPRLHLGTSVYTYKISNLISNNVDPADGLIVNSNEKEFRINGVEMQATAIAGNGVKTKASLALQQGGSATGSFNSPHYLAKLFIDGQLGSTGWNFSSSVEVIGPRHTLLDHLRADALANLSLSTRVLGGDLGIHAYNLLNRHIYYPAPFGYQQDRLPGWGRNFGVIWKSSL